MADIRQIADRVVRDPHARAGPMVGEGRDPVSHRRSGRILRLASDRVSRPYVMRTGHRADPGTNKGKEPMSATDDIQKDVIVQRVARAARNRHEADAEYRAAILHARAHGLSLTVIGRAAGVTKWGVKHTIQQAAKDGAS